MDDAEWQSLERSRLNAFVTSPDGIGAFWAGLLALDGWTMPPRARRRAIQPGRRTAIDVDELGEDLVDMDIIAYIRPPITSTPRKTRASARRAWLKPPDNAL